MEKWEISIQHFKNLIAKDYKEGSLKLVQQYFDDNIGMGEMYMHLVQLYYDSWYVANTDDMTLTTVEDYADEILENAEYMKDWLEEFYEENLKPKVYKICDKNNFILIKTNASNKVITKWCNNIAVFENCDIINIYKKPEESDIWEILGDTKKDLRCDLEKINYDYTIMLCEEQ